MSDNKNTPPFIKWVGGKRNMLDIIRERLPQTFENYYEPFAGGASIFFGLGKILGKAYLSDMNGELINTYNAVKLHPHELICQLEKYKELHNKEFYYRVRDSQPKGMVEKAARFIYLNRAGFRGMYRVNKKGKFNVPYGYGSVSNILKAERIIDCSKALENTTITRQPYLKIRPDKKDFVFLDPPYYKKKGMFTQYTKNGFDMDDQERFYEFFQTLDRKGVYVMVTHQDSPYIRKRYKDFNIESFPVKRRIANGKKKDTSTYDLIIRNYT